MRPAAAYLIYERTRTDDHMYLTEILTSITITTVCISGTGPLELLTFIALSTVHHPDTSLSKAGQ